VPEAVANTLKIAERCNVEIELGNIQLPHFEVPEGYDGDSYLSYLCGQGIERRYDGRESAEFLKQVRERLDYELAVIAKMGWPSYFLIVADFVNWAKNNKIVVGPGRGSAAGSLVCYLTGITNIDPLKYDLLFERFLNPDRISMPDIDLDFADIRREEVIRYVESKYGADHVAQIITFGTMAARAAVRDVGRVLDVPYEFCDKLSKLIPMFYKIDEALEEVAEFKDFYKSEPVAKQIVDYARTLEGVARHSSTHACGVLITKNPLTDYVPIQYASSSDRNIVSQYSLHPVEDLGLLKMDFLGLKNLTIIESALKIIKNTRGLEIDIDTIPLGDAEAYKLFQQGETTGVFQFESSGMKRYLRELKPTEFEDIIAMVALYRPGPMEWIPEYISGKHGAKKIEYLHPKLESILSKTFGVVIYQEQVMQISRELAGFTKGEADTLRKAMGKKIASLLAEQKEKFIKGCVVNGLSAELATKVFSFIEPFAGYGFNRSHAACYALLAYQTAYLKAHWPAEFMAALLTSDEHDIDRVAIEIDECRHMKMQIMPPDINESFASFTVVTSGTKSNQPIEAGEKVDTIRFGLNAVKNVGEHIAEAIITERKNGGSYTDIWNLLERIQDKDLNKKSLESLIKCGGMDSFGDRAQLLDNLETFLNYNKEFIKLKASRQSSLFGDSPASVLGRPKLKPAGAIDTQERLRWEKELLGLYVSEHPFNAYREFVHGYVKPLASLAGYKGDYDVKIAGVIASSKKIITRNSQSMLFVKIEDAGANVEILVFPRVLQADPALWQEGRVIICSGRVSDKDQEVKFLVDFAAPLEFSDIEGTLSKFKKLAMDNSANRKQNFYGRQNNGYAKAENKPVIKPEAPVPAASIAPAVPTESPLKLAFNKELSADDAGLLRACLLKFPGGAEVFLKVPSPEGAKVIKTSFRAAQDPALYAELEKIFSGTLTIAA
jgi:DNA polymerase-3 subunit alpha